MCGTCTHAIKMSINGKYSCNCPLSEYFRDTVSEDNFCDKYNKNADKQCAMDNGGQCRGLVEKRCDGCKFYKTQAQLDEERRNTLARLRSLPSEHQDYIKAQLKVKF